MATRSTISILETTGVVKQIYCHWDGYTEHNGRILKTFYKTPELVKELIANGDLSSLGEYINPVGEHSFDKPELNCCVYYGRDRGETATKYSEFENWIFFRAERNEQEFNYLYVEAEETWYLVNEFEELKTFLTELDNPVKTAYDMIFESPLIKETYVNILTGKMSLEEFAKFIEQVTCSIIEQVMVDKQSA